MGWKRKSPTSHLVHSAVTNYMRRVAFNQDVASPEEFAARYNMLSKKILAALRRALAAHKKTLDNTGTPR